MHLAYIRVMGHSNEHVDGGCAMNSGFNLLLKRPDTLLSYYDFFVVLQIHPGVPVDFLL